MCDHRSHNRHDHLRPTTVAPPISTTTVERGHHSCNKNMHTTTFIPHDDGRTPEFDDDRRRRRRAGHLSQFRHGQVACRSRSARKRSGISAACHRRLRRSPSPFVRPCRQYASRRGRRFWAWRNRYSLPHALSVLAIVEGGGPSRASSRVHRVSTT